MYFLSKCRRYANGPVRFTGSAGTTANCLVIIALAVNPYTAGGAALFYGATLLVAAWRAQPGCEASVVSNSILAGTPNLAHYEASKGGVMALTRALATELGKHGITVNSVAPGLTSNENTDKSPHADAYDFVQMLQAIPRRGVSADIAPAVAFLASEEAGWVTGQMLVVDAGMVRW